MADGPETTWRSITADEFIRLKLSMPALKEVSIRGGWALIFNDEPVAIWKTDIKTFRNVVMARLK